MPQLGRTKWFNREHGFGFIAPDDGGPDLYLGCADVLASGIRHLPRGQRVEFEIIVGTKGPQAHRLRLVHSRYA
ncbi:cold-shock protein [Nocardia callitridis]|uniref:Cold-shock protein n=1 Tax=Nocardia callitridis TaxID=648753 RepID=A0ABP9KMN2_9NOCA